MTDINLGVGAANSASGGYEIDNSLKLEADNNEWLYRASPTAGNRRTYTLVFGLKEVVCQQIQLMLQAVILLWEQDNMAECILEVTFFSI